MQGAEYNSTKKPEWSRFMKFVHSGGGQCMTRVYHYIGATFAFVASRLGLTPNMVTLISVICSVAAMLVLKVGGLGNALVAVSVFVLTAIAYALDCADGQLARATKQCTKLGVWLDHLMDAGKIFLVNFTIGWVLISHQGIHGVNLKFCFIAMTINITGSALYFFAWNFKVLLAGGGLIERLSDKKIRGAMKLLKLPHQIVDSGWFPFIFLMTIYPRRFAVVYSIYGVITLIVYLGYIIISARYMSKLKD